MFVNGGNDMLGLNVRGMHSETVTGWFQSCKVSEICYEKFILLWYIR